MTRPLYRPNFSRIGSCVLSVVQRPCAVNGVAGGAKDLKKKSISFWSGLIRRDQSRPLAWVRVKSVGLAVGGIGIRPKQHSNICGALVN